MAALIHTTRCSLVCEDQRPKNHVGEDDFRRKWIMAIIGRGDGVTLFGIVVHDALRTLCENDCDSTIGGGAEERKSGERRMTC